MPVRVVVQVFARVPQFLTLQGYIFKVGIEYTYLGLYLNSRHGRDFRPFQMGYAEVQVIIHLRRIHVNQRAVTCGLCQFNYYIGGL